MDEKYTITVTMQTEAGAVVAQTQVERSGLDALNTWDDLVTLAREQKTSSQLTGR